MQFQKAEVVFGLLVSLELFTATNQLSSCFAEKQLVAGAKEVIETQSVRHESHFDMLWQKMISFVSKHDLHAGAT